MSNFDNWPTEEEFAEARERLVSTWSPEDRGVIVGYRIRTGHTYAHIIQCKSVSPLMLSTDALCRKVRGRTAAMWPWPTSRTHWDAKRAWAPIPSLAEAAKVVAEETPWTACPECVRRATP